MRASTPKEIAEKAVTVSKRYGTVSDWPHDYMGILYLNGCRVCTDTVEAINTKAHDLRAAIVSLIESDEVRDCIRVREPESRQT